jgi:hypothetical protein
VTPRTKRISITAAITFAIAILSAAAAASAGLVRVGAVVQRVESDVAVHERRIGAVEVDLRGKADDAEVRASEARVKDALNLAVEQIRHDIRDLRNQRRGGP